MSLPPPATTDTRIIRNKSGVSITYGRTKVAEYPLKIKALLRCVVLGPITDY